MRFWRTDPKEPLSTDQKGPLSSVGPTQDAYWKWNRAENARLLALGVMGGTVMTGQPYWPLTQTDASRCEFEFDDGHRCQLGARHDGCDHLDLVCAQTAEVDKTDPRYRDTYGPTGFVREYADAQYDAFERNAGVIHEHSWLGGEIIHITHMPGEANYYECEWYCQFCGVRARGESQKYATTGTALLPPPDRNVSR